MNKIPIALAALLLGTACRNPSETAEFAVSHHAVLEGQVLGAAGQPLSSVVVTTGAPPRRAPSGGGHAVMDAEGRFAIRLERIASEYTAPEPDTISVPLLAAARPPVYASDAVDSTLVVVQYAPRDQTAPVTRVTIRLPVKNSP